MAKMYSADMIWLQGDSESIDMALYAHEREMFGNFMKKQSVEKAQGNAVNDTGQDSLSYLFVYETARFFSRTVRAAFSEVATSRKTIGKGV